MCSLLIFVGEGTPGPWTHLLRPHHPRQAENMWLIAPCPKLLSPVAGGGGGGGHTCTPTVVVPRAGHRNRDQTEPFPPSALSATRPQPSAGPFSCPVPAFPEKPLRGAPQRSQGRSLPFFLSTVYVLSRSHFSWEAGNIHSPLLIYLVFLGPHPQHMEVPGLGVESELQMPAYTTATVTQDLSSIGDVHHSS